MTVKEIFPHPLSVHSYLLRIRGGVGMYMESGLLDLLNIAPLNPDTYKPADLYYDDTLDAYWTESTALMGPIKISNNSITYDPRDEGKSLAVGCDEDDLTNRITMSDFIFSGDSEPATANSDVFCPETTGMVNEKRTQAFFPSSTFNAKMRLFIQSIYGSKREYSMDHDLESSGGIKFSGKVLSPYFDGFVLYTGPDYQYFVLQIRGGSVKVNRLDLSAQGEKLRLWLIDNPQTDEEQRRYEGYILSAASFGDWHTVGSVSTSGSAFGYNWKTNWAGTEAHKVTHQLKDGTTNVWEFTHYKLDISLTVDQSDENYWQKSANWSFALTEPEGTQEATFRIGGDLIWTPDRFAGGMQLFVTQSDANDDPVHVDSDVPIYPVYNYETDDFDMVRYKRQTIGTGDGAFGGEVGASDELLPTGGSECADGCEVGSTATSTVEEIGFYVDGSNDFTAAGLDSNNLEVSAVQYEKGSRIGLQGTINSTAGPNVTELCESRPDGDIQFHDTVFYDARGGQATMSGSMGHGSMLVIPFDDCDAVYLGYTEGFSGHVSSQNAPSGTVHGGYIYYDGDQVPLGEAERKTDWNRAGGAPTQSAEVFYLFFQSQDQGTYRDVSGNVQMNITEVKYYANGEFVGAHADNFVDDETIAQSLFLPECMLSHVPSIEAQMLNGAWQSDEYDTGGFEFGPVIFPTAENALPVVAKGNLTGNYRATKNPDQSNFIDEGEYDYDDYSRHISFVGHD